MASVTATLDAPDEATDYLQCSPRAHAGVVFVTVSGTLEGIEIHLEARRLGGTTVYQLGSAITSGGITRHEIGGNWEIRARLVALNSGDSAVVTIYRDT